MQTIIHLYLKEELKRRNAFLMELELRLEDFILTVDMKVKMIEQSNYDILFNDILRIEGMVNQFMIDFTDTDGIGGIPKIHLIVPNRIIHCREQLYAIRLMMKWGKLKHGILK